MAVSIVRKFMLGLASIIALSACGDSAKVPQTLLGSNYTYWKITDDAEKAYPKLEPMQARKRYVQDKFNEMGATLTPEQRRAEAANFYAGYMMLNAVAIPKYCGKMKIDITPFADGFRRRNAKTERSLDAVLTQQGITREQVWAKMERYAMSAAKNELLSAGKLQGSYKVCGDLRDKPETFLTNASFYKHFPSIAKALNTRPSKASHTPELRGM